jgi:aspartyl-tRNA synthetase
MNNKEHSVWKRDRYAGDLREEDTGQEVVLCGWVQKIRDMGHLVFIDLRDRQGIVQVVVSSENPSLLQMTKKIKMEFVIGVRGRIRQREEKLRNPDMITGNIEVEAMDIIVFNTSETLPFMVEDPPQASDEMRLKYRYLDLRRPSMQKNIRLRHKAAQAVRRFLDQEGFYEIETPVLTRSTPEGARDYLVPSRVYKGRFFALPQSPQIFKQILMISGYDRYFQIVKCFRDEDLRAERQPEFTQIDMEMSFIERDDIFDVSERMMTALFDLIGVKVRTPFPRLTYAESMSRYGTDKPDLRISGEIMDITKAALDVKSSILQGAMSKGGRVKAFVVAGADGFSRSRLDKLNDLAREAGGKGVVWIKRTGGSYKSVLKLEDRDLDVMWTSAGAGEGDLLLLAAGPEETASKVLGHLRLFLGKEKGVPADAFRFVWITDFPLFEWNVEENRMISMHHPFTSIHEEDNAMLEINPFKVRARAYDMVLNGIEIGGGSLRIHNRDMQQRIFEVLGLSQDETEEKFGFFLKALTFGTPPHGGIAFGFDRIVMLLAGETSIRQVIPFPKTTSSLSLMTDAPAPVADRQLKELGLRLIKK